MNFFPDISCIQISRPNCLQVGIKCTLLQVYAVYTRLKTDIIGLPSFALGAHYIPMVIY